MATGDNIGTIKIAVTVDVGQVQTQLKDLENQLRSVKLPAREVPITIKVNAPSDDAIKRVRGRIKTQLDAAASNTFTVTPTMKVSDISATNFVKDIEQHMSNQAVKVPIIADIDEVAFRTQIRDAAGTLDIPVTWHWARRPPGNRGGGGGAAGGPPADDGGGGGGGNVRPGFRRGPRPPAGPGTPGNVTGPTAAAEQRGGGTRPPKAPTQTPIANPPPQTPAAAPVVPAATGAAGTRDARGRFLPKPPGAPAQSAPVAPVAGTPAGILQAPATPPPGNVLLNALRSNQPKSGLPLTATPARQTVRQQPGGAHLPGAEPVTVQLHEPTPGATEVAPRSGASPLAGTRVVPTPDSERPGHLPPLISRPGSDPTVSGAVFKMGRFGDEGNNGVLDAMKLGLVIGNEGAISFKKRSVLGSGSQEDRDSVIKAFQALQTSGDYTPPSRSGMGGRARRLAAGTGITKENVEFNNWIQQLLAGKTPGGGGFGQDIGASKKATRYRTSEIVQRFKAAVAAKGGGEQGFLSQILGDETGRPVRTNDQGYLIPSSEDEEGNPQYPSLRDALGLLEEGNTISARAVAYHHGRMMFAENPALAAQVLSATRTREVNPKTGEEIIPDPFAESLASAYQAILGEAKVVNAPRLEAQESAQRKIEFQARNDTGGLSPDAKAARIRDIQEGQTSKDRERAANEYIERFGPDPEALKPIDMTSLRARDLELSVSRRLRRRPRVQYYDDGDISRITPTLESNPGYPGEIRPSQRAEKVSARLLRRFGREEDPFAAVEDYLGKFKMRRRAEGGAMDPSTAAASWQYLRQRLFHHQAGRPNLANKLRDVRWSELEEMRGNPEKPGEGFAEPIVGQKVGPLYSEEGPLPGHHSAVWDEDHNPFSEDPFGVTGKKFKGMGPDDFRKVSKNAEGGQLRHSGVVGRTGTSLTMVGERGPELIETDQAGNAEVIPAHRVQSRLSGRAEGGDIEGRLGKLIPGDSTNLEQAHARMLQLRGSLGQSDTYGRMAEVRAKKQREEEAAAQQSAAEDERRERQRSEFARQRAETERQDAARRLQVNSALNPQAHPNPVSEMGARLRGTRLGYEGMATARIGAAAEHEQQVSGTPVPFEISRAEFTFAQGAQIRFQAAGGAAQSAPAAAMAAGPATAAGAGGRARNARGQFAAGGGVPPIGSIFHQAQAAGGGGGGGGGAGGAGGAAGGGGGGDPQLSAQRRAELDLQQLEEETRRRLEIKRIQAKLSAAGRELPTRGVQTATGEISAINLGGLRGIIEKRRLAEESAIRTGAIGAGLGKATRAQRTTEAKLQQATDPEQVARLTVTLEDQTRAVGLWEQAYKGASEETAGFAKNVVGATDKLRVFAANTTGIIAGTFIFSGALTAVTAGLSAIGEAIAPVIERSTGFQNVAAKVTGALADQTRTAGGAVKQVVALAAAQTGLNATTFRSIAPTIQGRSETEAGNKGIQEQLDLLHSAESIRGQNANQPGGFDKGLFSTTGGVFGTDLNGVPSTAELFNKEFNDFGGGLPTLAERQQGAKAPGNPLDPNTLLRTIGGAEDLPRRQEAYSKAIELSTDRLAYFNKQAEKGGDTLTSFALATSQGEIDTSAKAAFDAGLTELGKTIQERGLAIKGAQAPEDLFKFFQAVNVGSSRPSSDLLIQSAKDRQIPNQVAAINEEERRITRPTLGAQEAIDFAANRPQPFGAGLVQINQGVTGETPLNAPKNPAVDEAATQSFNTYSQVATSALDKVIATAKEGEQALAQLGVPPDLIAEMTKLGSTASSIKLGIADQQAAFSAQQYNNQMRILNRSLQDAYALQGKRSTAEGHLGQLERENFEINKRQAELQFRSQELGLILSQRQINFQRAVAGFVAPGTTPEERAARIQEAKIEANFAQKQLDIQKQLLGLGKSGFKVGIGIFNENSKRQVEDLRHSIAEAVAGHRLELNSKAANDTLDIIQARMGQISSRIGIAITKATKIASAEIGQALDIANASGEAFSKILGETASAWNTFISQGVDAVNQIQPGGGGGDSLSPGGKQDEGSKGNNAPGWIGQVSSATHMTVGEAGSETVAVLRNVRTSAVPTNWGGGGGGGGGVNVTIVVNGAETKNPDELAEVIARKVEATLMRKTSLFGLRRN